MQRTGQDTVYPGSMASPRRSRMVSARTSISAFGRSSRCCRLRSIARPSTGSPRSAPTSTARPAPENDGGNRVARPWITRRLADGKPALYYRAPVPGGVIFAMKRGSGPRAVLLHGGPGLGAESILGLLDELIDTVEASFRSSAAWSPASRAGHATSRPTSRTRSPCSTSSSGNVPGSSATTGAATSRCTWPSRIRNALRDSC